MACVDHEESHDSCLSRLLPPQRGERNDETKHASLRRGSSERDVGARPGLSAVDGETEAAALEAAEGVTWLEEESAGKAVGSAALGHSAPCGVTADVQTRDVLSHTRLSLELWERRRMPPAEGEEGDGEEGEAVRIGVGVAVVTGGEDDVTPPAVEGVGLESLPEAAATSLCGALPSPHRRASSQLATCCLAALLSTASELPWHWKSD